MATLASILKRFPSVLSVGSSFKKKKEVTPQQSPLGDGLQEVKMKIQLGAIPAELKPQEFKKGLVVAYRNKRCWHVCVVEGGAIRKKVPLRPIGAEYSIHRTTSPRRRWYAAA